MELFLFFLCVFIAYFMGANFGYAAGREYKEDESIINVEVMLDMSSNIFLVYEMKTKKFILQTTEEERLPELLSAKFPTSKIVVSRIV